MMYFHDLSSHDTEAAKFPILNSVGKSSHQPSFNGPAPTDPHPLSDSVTPKITKPILPAAAEKKWKTRLTKVRQGEKLQNYYFYGRGFFWRPTLTIWDSPETPQGRSYRLRWWKGGGKLRVLWETTSSVTICHQQWGLWGEGRGGESLSLQVKMENLTLNSLIFALSDTWDFTPHQRATVVSQTHGITRSCQRPLLTNELAAQKKNFFFLLGEDSNSEPKALTTMPHPHPLPV